MGARIEFVSSSGSSDADALPRMDVAGFVGLARSGPLDTPVPVDGVARFMDLFQGSPVLGWSETDGRSCSGHLEGAVRAFFRAGGRKCWVVRVAPRPLATAGWTLPGLVAFAGATPRSVRGRFRCPGPVPDDSRLRAALHAASPGVVVAAANGRFDAGWLTNLGAKEPGSLVELVTPDGTERGLGFVRRDAATGRSTLAAADISWFGRGSGQERIAYRLDADGTRRRVGPVEPLARGSGLRVRYDAEAVVGPGDLLSFSGPGGLPIQPTSTALVLAADREGFTYSDPVVALPSRSTVPGGCRARALTLALVAERRGSTLATFADLAFGAEHPRFWGKLPSDSEAFAPDWLPLRETLRDPGRRRFPFAGTESVPSALPLHVPSESAAGPASLPEVITDDGLDFLTSRSIVDACFDPELVGVPLAGLDRALRAVAAGRSLARGAHGLLAIEEVSLVAIPDACAPGTIEGAPPAPPRLRAPVLQVAAGRVRWTRGARLDLSEVVFAVHRLELGRDERFQSAEVYYRGIDTDVLAPAPDACSPRLWLRVRGEADGIVTPWSDVRELRLASALVDCADDQTTDEAPIEPARPAATPSRQTVPLESLDAVLDAHVWLTTACFARGDQLAVLSLPPRTRADATLEHLEHLRDRLLGAADERVLEYATVAHGWLCTLGERSDLLVSAPEGVVSGLVARRSLGGGVWISPAGLAVPDGVDTSIELALGDTVGLSPLTRTPRGIELSGARTLARSGGVQQVSVRLLLSLLRRLLAREGERFVFANLTRGLYREVTDQLERVLSRLWRRGAFIGKTAREAFLVVADERVNPPGSRERGVYQVDVLVSPSQPLERLTIRLLGPGGGPISVEELAS